MSGRAVASWQTSLADLSLILFMVTAAAVSGKPAPPQVKIPSVAEGLSVYLDTPDAPPFPRWLAEQAADPRQRLTITATCPSPPFQDAALRRALDLAREAGKAGYPARIVIEPGAGGPLRAVLAYDQG